MKKSIVLVLLCLLGKADICKSQVDPHFSQYYVYPLWLNPSLTGAIDENYRVSAIYRTQWSNISDPYATIGVSADFKSEKTVHFGFNVMQQSAGSGGYKYYNAQFSLSYTGLVFGSNDQHHIAFALQPGVIGRRFDVSAFKGGDQWVPIIGYNPNIPTTDILVQNSSTSLDIGAGVSYYSATEEDINVFGGFAVGHLTQPEDPFMLKGIKSRLPMRYTLHAGARIVLSDNASIVPNALLMKQGQAKEIMLGGYVQLAAGESAEVMLGTKYRFNDAISPFVAFMLERQLMIGLSYDVNQSQLGKMASGSNAFEISFTFLGKPRDNYLKCPRF
jgi:type IX secretion system PorP/SprF family membrane protein